MRSNNKFEHPDELWREWEEMDWAEHYEKKNRTELEEEFDFLCKRIEETEQLIKKRNELDLSDEEIDESYSMLEYWEKQHNALKRILGK